VKLEPWLRRYSGKKVQARVSVGSQISRGSRGRTLAADPGCAYPRAGSPKYPLFFFFFKKNSTSQKGAFHQIVKKSQNLLYKKTYFF
jgi:hypothetical protein